jgi:hypothetical protein
MTAMTTTLKTPLVRFSKAIRNRVANASNGGPTVQGWLDRIAAIGDPLLTSAIDGIWCGREGTVTLDLPGSRSMLCMGWYNKRVEWSYLS